MRVRLHLEDSGDVVMKGPALQAVQQPEVQATAAVGRVLAVPSERVVNLLAAEPNSRGVVQPALHRLPMRP